MPKKSGTPDFFIFQLVILHFQKGKRLDGCAIG
jgi:hypothetical protein